MRQPPKPSRTKEFVDEDVEHSGLEGSSSYEKPKKLPVPCARVQNDGQWFQIDRVLDTISVVGSNERVQSLVQWKPSWTKQKRNSSAVRDFCSRTTVKGCVVKGNTLRSKSSLETDWNHKKFMCLNFRIRIDTSAGSSTFDDVPYDEVKRRFPTALFEYFEGIMTRPRVQTSYELRRDGRLSLYNKIAIPRNVFLKMKVKKEDRKEVKSDTDVHSTKSGKKSVLRTSFQKLNCIDTSPENDANKLLQRSCGRKRNHRSHF